MLVVPCLQVESNGLIEFYLKRQSGRCAHVSAETIASVSGISTKTEVLFVSVSLLPQC